MHVVLIEIEFSCHLVVREVEPHDIPAEYPHAKGVMLAGKERGRHIVKASLAGLAQGALTLGLGVVEPLFSNIKTITPWTIDTVWPA